MQRQRFYMCFIFVILIKYCEALELRGYRTEVYVIRYFENGHITPATVFLNFDQQTELVISGKAGRKSETFYDFLQGYVAYKDGNSGQCFIQKLEGESLQADNERLKNVQNGILREFYLPTFTIQEEVSGTGKILQKFGQRVTEFCKGSAVSLVQKEEPMSRKKRDVSATLGNGQKGRFTHHSYGHYGQQSNNYAHYGHETHISGTVDKDGNIRDQRVQHHQMRSEGSQSIPLQTSPNGFTSKSDSQRLHQTRPTLSQVRSAPQNNLDIMGKEFGGNSGGQFSLQTDQESGYQLNLPLGLTAGSAYRGGIRSQGQYGVGGLQPQISTEFQRYPSGRETTRGISDAAKVGGLPTPPDYRGPIPPTQPQPRLQYTNGRVLAPPGFPGLRYDEHGRRPTTTDAVSARRFDEHGRPITADTALRHGYDEHGRPITADRVSSRHYDEHGRPLIADVVSGRRYDGFVRPVIADMVSSRRYDEHGKPLTADVVSGRRYDEHGRPLTADGVSSRRYDEHGRPLTADGVSSRRYDEHGRPLTADVVSGRRYDEHGRPLTENVVSGRRYDEHGRLLSADVVSGRRYDEHLRPLTADGVSSRRYDEHGRPIITDATSGFGSGDLISPQVPRVGTSPSIHKVISQPDVPFSGISDNLRPGMPTTSGQPHASVWGSEKTEQLPDTSLPGYPISGGDASVTRDILHARHRPGPSIDGRAPGYMPTLPALTPGSSVLTPQGTLSMRTTGSQQEGSSRGVMPNILGGQIPRHPSSSGVQERPYVLTDSRTPTDIRRTPYLPPTDGLDDSRRISTDTIPGQILDSDGSQVDSFYRSGTPSRFMDTTGRGRFTQPGALGADASRVYPASAWRRTADGVSSIGARGPGDSASSQTQIQSAFEGTAAEASAAGNYQGLGSQTQVQGGYTGNGSFSAQAQSGFTGGLTQSQIQGGKQGGLSGSSAQVERVGSAQSQVQIGQPSGSASSSAQGIFSTGTTQVQAQSSKTGGNAEAQAQSRGLSNSQAQVNIGGGDSGQKNGFQGTVSASVLGGLSSAQSQTQLQGGYESGRMYSATAQGGFDSMSEFQGSIPADGSLPSQPRLTRIIAPHQQTYLPNSRTNDTQYVTGVNGERIYPVIPESASRTTNGIGIPGANGIVKPNITHPRALHVRYHPPGYESFQPDYPSHLIAQGIPGALPGTLRTLPRGQEIPGSMTSMPGMRGVRPSVSGTPQIIPALPSISGISGPPSSVPGVPSIPISPAIQGVPVAFPSVSGTPQISPALPSLSGISGSPSIPGVPSIPISGTILGMPKALPSISEMPGGLSSIHGMAIPGASSISGEQSSLSGIPRSSGSLPSFPGRPEIPPGSFLGIPESSPGTLMQQYPYYHSPIQLPIHSRYPGYEQVQPGYPVSGRLPGMIPMTSLPNHLPSQMYPVDSKPDVTSGILQPPAGRRPVDIPNDFQTSLPGPPGSPSSSGLQPLIPGQPQISPTGPASPDDSQQRQLTLPSFRVPDQPVQKPGPHEPDGKECCEALKNLKQRCCGRSTSSCCSGSQSDSDFSLDDDDIDSNGENACKIVKAICYIVYKPVGKARICKPTKTNGCR